MAAPAPAAALDVRHTVWQQDDVDPAGVEQAMRALERERFQRESGALPARALNLVAVVDASFAGEIVRRLEAIGRNAPSRTILVRVSPRRTTLGARVTLTLSDELDGSHAAATALNELITLDVGARHVPRLDSIVDPMVMTDVPTLVWAPHGHRAAVDALAPIAQTVMLDSSDAADPATGLEEVDELLQAHQLGVVDLSWLRATPWRQRLAAHYAPPERHANLWSISDVAVRHHPGSEAAAWLMVGWFADRLHWTVGDGGILGHDGREVRLHLSAVDVGVQGLSGATVTSCDGSRFSLDRNPGGLRAHRVDGDAERRWTVLGASRGEAGVLGRALRRTLVPDDGYVGALAAARRLAAAG